MRVLRMFGIRGALWVGRQDQDVQPNHRITNLVVLAELIVCSRHGDDRLLVTAVQSPEGKPGKHNDETRTICRDTKSDQ